MFFTPFSFIGSLRTFYVVLFLFNIACLIRPPRYHISNLTALMAISTLCFVSASYALFANMLGNDPISANPILRAAVITNLFIGFYYLSLELATRRIKISIIDAMQLSYRGFTAVFILGTILYIGHMTGKVPISIYSKFVSLYQVGYGYLRLSPGTYPNEFGILCSFYSLYALSIYGLTRKPVHIVLFLAFFAGILLTSTRAAYLTFLLGFIWMLLFFPRKSARLRYLLIVASAIPGMLLLLSVLSIDVLSILEKGINALSRRNTGSVGVRFADWQTAMENFQNNPTFGVGFESPMSSMLHNVPLQLAYGLGLVPMVIFVGLFVIFFINNFNDSNQKVLFKNRTECQFADQMRLILLVHVIIFALTNHNQTHFFTWFCFMLYCLKYRRLPSQSLSQPSQNLSTEQNHTQTQHIVNTGIG